MGSIELLHCKIFMFFKSGVLFAGAKVSDTIRKGIIDIGPYVNDTDTLMMGNVAALSGTCGYSLLLKCESR